MKPNRGSKALFASQRTSKMPSGMQLIKEANEEYLDFTKPFEETNGTGEARTAESDSQDREGAIDGNGITLACFVQESNRELASEYLSFVEEQGHRSQRVSYTYVTSCFVRF